MIEYLAIAKTKRKHFQCYLVRTIVEMRIIEIEICFAVKLQISLLRCHLPATIMQLILFGVSAVSGATNESVRAAVLPDHLFFSSVFCSLFPNLTLTKRRKKET